ncbi:MAG: flagellar hook basal-body protein [Verrucomicrobiota bacterium]|nr:flagellar hook basal-body protein [Limisphaera sp.]MDW8381518.1 flagellar hook basal-body protein [Verrucomicrobiota bacterium]
MNVSLYQAAAAMNAHARVQDLITQNLAMSGVPAARRWETSIATVPGGYASGAPQVPGHQFHIPRVMVGTNFSQGELTPSESPTDVAIDGPAFFEVQLPDGTLAYTRRGQFHIDAQGYLVTYQGHRVMGLNGPIQLDPSTSAPVTITPEGRILQGQEPRGQLRLVEFNDPRRLRPLPGGVFLAQDPALIARPATQSRVLQGTQEASNISPLHEMASLITTLRLFEANQRVLQAQDERMGRIIAELGNPG